MTARTTKTAAKPASKKTPATEEKKTVKAAKTSSTKRITFTYAGKPGDVVTIHGSFNDWQEAFKTLADKNNDGQFSCTCMLKPGRYEYKLQVNGLWITDETNPNFVQNAFGSLNNILEF